LPRRSPKDEGGRMLARAMAQAKSSPANENEEFRSGTPR
jgi:hypothetical protein